MRWQVREIDGHDLDQVLDGLDWAVEQRRPAVLLAHTIKGKGVSFMEGNNAYHGVAPSEDEEIRALAELETAALAGAGNGAAVNRKGDR
jgi:transketolase